MIRRWVIRAFAVLLCCGSVGACLLGTMFPLVANISIGRNRGYQIAWLSTDMTASTYNRHGSVGFECRTYGPAVNAQELAFLKEAYAPRWQILGLGHGRIDAYAGPIYFLRFPLWFLSLLSVLFLVLAFRRTKRIAAEKSFPVEPKPAQMASDASQSQITHGK